MSYQGDDPNRPPERQRTEPSRTSTRHTGTQPTHWQGQPQGTPPQQPPAQSQYTQGSLGTPQGATGQPGEQQPVVPGGQQSVSQPGFQQPGTYQQQGTQPLQSSGWTGTVGQSGQMGQFTQSAGMGGRQRPPKTRMSPASLEEVISTDVVTAQRDTPIATVAAMLNEHSVGCVVVVESDGRTPIGVLTDRKIALAVETEPEIGKRTAEELVSSNLLTGRTDMTVFEALDTLKEAGVRRLPIVDEEGALAGIVTLDDLLILLGTNLQDAAEIIASQTTPRT